MNWAFFFVLSFSIFTACLDICTASYCEGFVDYGYLCIVRVYLATDYSTSGHVSGVPQALMSPSDVYPSFYPIDLI